MLENILFFFAALGVFNAFLLSIYLFFFKKNRRLYDFFLGILLCFLVVRVGISCFYYFKSVPIPFIKIGLISNLFLGPTVWSFSLMSKTKDRKILNYYLIQLTLFFFVVIFLWILFDFKTWDTQIRYSIHVVLSIYLLFTLITLRNSIWSLIKGQRDSYESYFMAIVFCALLSVCLGFVISLWTTYILGPLVFSIIFYATYVSFVFRSIGKKKSYSKKISDDLFEPINKKLVRIMETENVYRNPDLTLDVLANQLGVSRHFLSQILNDNLKKTFHQYINEYRIDEACHILHKKQPLSIEAIGYEVGFRSKSSFFATFKRIKNMTPSKFKETV
ncbi:MAG: helix-turn-helix domain-containing protein [Croceivirga sp.]